MSLFGLIKGRWGSSDGQIDDARIDASTNSFQTVEYEHHEVHSGSHFHVDGYAELGLNAEMWIKLIIPDNTAWGHFLWEINSNGILETYIDEDATGGMVGVGVSPARANNRNVNCWTGIDTGAGSATVLTDSTQAWTVDALIDMQVFNTTDGSSGIITDNDATTVTVTALTNGTANAWANADRYEINKSRMIIIPDVTACTGYTQRLENIKFGSKSSGGSHSRGDESIMKQNTVYCRYFKSGTASNIMNFKISWYEHTDKH
jgi:hypothetical protein